jgi:hypothetical protein
LEKKQEIQLFPTWLLVHQRMNANGNSTKWFIFLKQKYNECNVTRYNYTLSSWRLYMTLCMLAFWSHEGVVFLSSPHLITSFHLPCLGSTDAHCPRLGDLVPLPPKWRPFPQGPHTLPYRGSEH